MASATVATALFLLLWNPEIRAEGSNDHPICIIGGGISGLTLAIRLQEKGYNVHLFEQANRFGGKLDTFEDEKEGLILERGPMFLGIEKKSYIYSYSKKYNLTSIPYNIQDKALFDPESGRYLGLDVVTDKQRTELIRCAKEYASFYNQSELEEVGYSNIDPNSDYAKPISVWLQERGLSPLARLFHFYLTLYGYGDLSDIPALYALKYIVPEGLIYRLESKSNNLVAAEGLSVLADRMASSVKHQHLRHELVKLVRRNGRQDVTFLIDGKTEHSFTCSKTVITFIPLLSNIVPVVGDLTSEERGVLEMVKVTKYASSGHTIPALNHTIHMVPYDMKLLSNLDHSSGRGEVVVFAKAGKGANPHGYISYSWLSGDYDSEGTAKDEEMMKRKVHQILKEIDTRSQTYFFKSYQYFPHVTGESIRKGFYKKLEEMQGNGGLYYACPILTFDGMNFAIELGEKFADKFFNGD